MAYPLISLTLDKSGQHNRRSPQREVISVQNQPPAQPADALKGRTFPVLDKGHIVLLDCIGSDLRVVEAARVSTGSKAGDIEKDRKLISFLMENHHETPFEHVVFQFMVKCPIFVARQWFRHRIASYNERSARYRVFEEEFYMPRREDLPGVFDDRDLADYAALLQQEHALYQRLIERGNQLKGPENLAQRRRAREVFRGLLGTAYYTEFYWTINFRSLMNFLNLRTSGGAQLEIRRYAEVLAGIAKQTVPLCYEAFERYVLRRPAG